MNSIGSRITELRGKLSQKKFADNIGISRMSLVRYEKDEIPPGYLALLRIAKRYNVNINWLMTGSVDKNDPKQFPSDLLIINQWNATFAMGGGQYLDQVDVIKAWSVSKEWLSKFAPSYLGSPNKLKIVTGIGDCFAPFYKDGDLLLVDSSFENQKLTSTGIYAFRFDDLHYIKELRPVGSKMIHAYEKDNTKAFDIKLHENIDFYLYAKVIKAWRIE